ncbi:MAG: CPBP family glutamic-type intramembrane protease [archaeon]
MDIAAFWTYFRALEPWYMTPLYLGLFTLAVTIPFRLMFIHTGYTRCLKFRHWALLTPIVEELVFRFLLLSLGIMFFGFVGGFVFMLIAYTTYTAFLYGPPYMGDAVVIGLVFGLAVFELGIVTVILAHMVYKVTQLV